MGDVGPGVGQQRSEGDSRPEAPAPEHERGKGDPGGRPDRGHAPRLERELQAQLGRAVIDRGQQGDPTERVEGEPPELNVGPARGARGGAPSARAGLRSSGCPARPERALRRSRSRRLRRRGEAPGPPRANVPTRPRPRRSRAPRSLRPGRAHRRPPGPRARCLPRGPRWAEVIAHAHPAARRRDARRSLRAPPAGERCRDPWEAPVATPRSQAVQVRHVLVEDPQGLSLPCGCP